jgi:hypothetical protein
VALLREGGFNSVRVVSDEPGVDGLIRARRGAV